MNPPHNPPHPNNNMTSRPPPPTQNPPPRNPPPPNSTTADVDEAIARRRAQLRRLQAKNSAPRPVGLPGGPAAANAPGLQNRFGAVGNAPTPSAVRRLDNSYGTPVQSQQPGKPPQTKPDLTHYKRTSEIFQRGTVAGTTPPVAARTRSAKAAVQEPTQKAAESPVLTSASPQLQPSRSPFGGARATLVPALPIGDKNVFVPPLVLESVVKNSPITPVETDLKKGDSQQNNVKGGGTKEQEETPSKIVGYVSGESTPVTSNSLSTEKTLLGANRVLMDAQKQPPKVVNDTASNLERIDNVKVNQEQEQQQHQRSKSNPALIEQLNRAVALKGEKAVLGLLEKLEKPSSSPFNPPLTPRGRSMDLLSSMGTPLTPRSRPSSPERWNNNPPAEKKRTAPVPKGETMETHYILQASKIIPNEYGTELVNYIARRPSSTKFFDYDFFSSEETYREKFDIDDSESVDVLAHIEADGSVFALIGKNVRHGKFTGVVEGDNESLEWSVYENLEESSVMLGSVTYIDMEGNEREYWLESIYDEAMSIRESYCTAVRSAACALKHAANNELSGEKKSEHAHETPQGNQFPPQGSHLPSMSEQAHGDISQVPFNTSNPSIPLVPNLSQAPPTMPAEAKHMPTPVDANESQKEQVGQTQPPVAQKQATPSDQSQKPSSTNQKKPQEQTKDQPEEFELADSALPLMVASIISVLFSLIWFTFFKLPYRVCSTVLTICFILMSCRILWLLLADDNGAWEMGAGVDFQYNSPGIY